MQAGKMKTKHNHLGELQQMDGRKDVKRYNKYTQFINRWKWHEIVERPAVHREIMRMLLPERTISTFVVIKLNYQVFFSVLKKVQ